MQPWMSHSERSKPYITQPLFLSSKITNFYANSQYESGEYWPISSFFYAFFPFATDNPLYLVRFSSFILPNKTILIIWRRVEATQNVVEQRCQTKWLEMMAKERVRSNSWLLQCSTSKFEDFFWERSLCFLHSCTQLLTTIHEVTSIAWTKFM